VLALFDNSYLAAGLLAAAVGAGYCVRLLIGKLSERGALQARERILTEARRDAEQIKKEMELQAKHDLMQRREELETEIRQVRNELRQTERRLDKREDGVHEKEELLSKKEKFLETAEKTVAEKRKELSLLEDRLKELEQKQQEELHRISGLTTEDAKRMLLESLREQVESECTEMINSKVAHAERTGRQEAQRIIVESIERCAAETTSEATVCTVELPNDDVKGRIIGREGRNIRAFEKAIGVDVIVDDTPGVVVLSSFDSVRREAARLAMQRLVADGRIHPARIEEAVTQATADIERIINETGEEVCYEMDLSKIPEALKRLLGRLKFRTSFGQNVLEHSVQVCELAGLMAAEIGLDVQLARRCGLLHDVGKAIDQRHEGSHAALGAEEAQKRGEAELVVNAIAAHHEEVPAQSLYAGLLIASDAISASRPGARRETLERYVKRLERLESLATQHSGVARAFAIQAGREVRVLVDSNKIADQAAARLSQDIAREIEEELQYPGEILVTVIRETRFQEVAH
jgi:ribonuclease Y